ncbi:MAG: hypothetical protein IJ338_03325, partial [Bacteroidaceae bacterium]|nr:hypothetical protein [Bacteroidaceae bacterium]
MRKHILILFLLIANVIYVFGQYEEVRKELDEVYKRSLPYTKSYTERSSPPSIPFTAPLLKKMELPVFIYDDYECAQKTYVNPMHASGVARFTTETHDCEVALFCIADECYSAHRYLLATFDKTGKRIDYIEVGLGWESGVCLELFSIDTAMQVVVNKLTPMEKEPVHKYDFKSFTGYRTDTYYQILANGEIIKTKEVVFEPQLYYPPKPTEEEIYYFFISTGDEKVKTIKECN